MLNSSTPSIPRPEYPRPQFVRDQWINLNGLWEFEFDHGKSGEERKLYESKKFSKEIVVPFCPESKLSGIKYKDFISCIWYRREFTIPGYWFSNTNRILIHFGAVDYEAKVWVNGEFAGTHRGGYTPFTFDITTLVTPGVNIVTLCAEDDVRSGLQPRGKQSSLYYSHKCDYTRTTGIWQTVWLECVPNTYIKSCKYIPDVENGCIHIEAYLNEKVENYIFNAKALYNGKYQGEATIKISGSNAYLTLKLSEVYLWEPGNPHLYDLELCLCKEDKCIDTVKSYFGLRSISLSKTALLINSKVIFQRLVLDQGFYPDGIYTAPTDEDLKKDIELSMNLGFNGARLHEKIFEPRFLYWADKLGYIVWGEHGNWGLDITTPMGLERFLPEWLEALERDFNHPSIIGWCPFNETRDNKNGTRQDDEVLRIVYNITKAIDKTRPVIDTSGYCHVATDIFDVHDYEQDPEKFASHYESLKTGGEVFVNWPERQKYNGEPYFVSEYGGIWWSPGNDKGWGYGKQPASLEEFIERYKGLTEALLNNPRICGFCYTQLYDIEQEVNGLYTYERKPKFSADIMETIRGINSQKAAIEQAET